MTMSGGAAGPTPGAQLVVAWLASLFTFVCLYVAHMQLLRYRTHGLLRRQAPSDPSAASLRRQLRMVHVIVHGLYALQVYLPGAFFAGPADADGQRRALQWPVA